MQLDKSKVGIVIVAYNDAEVIIKQIECIRKFCKDKHDVIVVDNSSDLEKSEAIKYHTKERECLYMRTEASSVNGSGSHAFAANVSYHKIHGVYEFLFYLDHDCFPVKDFSVEEILYHKTMAGLGQTSLKSGKEYFWAGCVMWDERKVPPSMIDFSPNLEFGLDTGGNLYRLMEEIGKEECLFFNEKHVQNPEFNKSFYNFYAVINDEMFMHFLNSSDWAQSEHNEERINSLFNILNNKIT